MSKRIPKIDGPKLSPFRGSLENVEFLKVLGPGLDPSGSSTDWVPHSHVFLVRINGKRYSLKVFNFFSIDELLPFYPGAEHLFTDDLVRYHLDPFYAECRVFGLLIQKKKDDALAVRCHGYAMLPQKIEKQIRDRFGIDGWNRQPDDAGTPLRAILKDYIRFKTACGRKKLPAMRSNLRKLNGMGIFNMDIKEDNYRGGRLFDFSIALTPPHVWLWPSVRSRAEILEDCAEDEKVFDRMAKQINKRREEAEAEAGARWTEGIGGRVPALRLHTLSKRNGRVSKSR
ncbi:kinetochore Sim4 complex subunit FTA2-domain-containing protein [Astrocystis sublimbata]|nr:kinetochore Sim4 complex subunit FTA2-domain-containing protein [Astrocystis sublimbata]